MNSLLLAGNTVNICGEKFNYCFVYVFVIAVQLKLRLY